MKIDPVVYSAKFPKRCRVDHCRSRCCRFGVWVDVGEKESILANAALFARLLRPGAADPEAWFGRTVPDADCPSGFAVETMEVGGYCVFFSPGVGCVLQRGAADAGRHEWALKPRFCVMFPLVVTGGTLTVDEEMTSLWCMQPPNRTHLLLASVRRELRHLFGEALSRKLLARTESAPASFPRPEPALPAGARDGARPINVVR